MKDLEIKGAPISEHPAFESAIVKLHELQGVLLSCEAELSENAHLLRRQMSFIMQSLVFFLDALKIHSLEDIK